MGRLFGLPAHGLGWDGRLHAMLQERGLVLILGVVLSVQGNQFAQQKSKVLVGFALICWMLRLCCFSLPRLRSCGSFRVWDFGCFLPSMLRLLFARASPVCSCVVVAVVFVVAAVGIMSTDVWLLLLILLLLLWQRWLVLLLL